MIRLCTLGSVDLRDTDDREVAAVLAQPKRLALLVYLAAARPAGLRPREQLLALFWPELDEARARDSLSQALRFLRHSLGSDVLARRGTDVGVDPSRVRCDAAEFRTALSSGRHRDAVELYRGDFLSGFWIENGGGFDEWVERERADLRQAASRAARELGEEHERHGAFTLATSWMQRALELAPDDERALRRLLLAYDRGGDRAGALHAYEDFARRLAAELQCEPSSATLELVSRLRRGEPGAPLDAASTGVAPAGLVPSYTAIVPRRSATASRAEAPGDLESRYRIERELVSGGMATVYLARDLRHDRQVALKILRPEIASVLATERFQREISIAARLQHPGIVPLFDSGETPDGRLFYIMPYVTGETLRGRLERAPRPTFDEVVRVLRDLTDALAYAHGEAVIHRDIKPENVLLSAERALISDFGIARAAFLAGGPATVRVGGERLTHLGTSLGTPGYMAPEQVFGTTPVDGRADLYALGAVAYELLAGRPAFRGATPEDVLEAQLTARPVSLDEIRPDAPRELCQLVMRCVEREIEARPRSAAEVAEILGGLALPPRPGWAAPLDGMAPRITGALRHYWRRARPVFGRRIGWMLGFVGLVLGAVGGTWLTTRPVDNASSIRFPVDLPDGLRLLWPFTPVALSPDGRTLAFVGTDVAGPPRIFVRPLGQMIARELSGTRNAEQIFFSPDGRWIGFYTGLALRKVSIEGGAPLFIADVPQMAGASWTRDDEIVVSSQGRLALLSANGGPLRPIIAPDSAGWRAILPHVLEDGTTIVYTARPKMLEDSRIAVASLRGGASRVLDLPGTTPLGVIDGHLLYLTSRNLTYARNSISAVPFDVRRRVTTGPPAPLIDSVAMNAAGHVSASLSSSGSLVYVFRGDYRSRLVLRGMDGSQRVVTPEARYYLNPRFSPDGRRIAVDIESDTSTQRFVHILDPASGALTQLSTRPGVGPEWTADGTRILFSSRGELWIRKADLSTPEELLLGGKDLQHASGPIPAYDGALSRDERILVARVQLPDGNRKLLYRIVGDTSLRPVGFTPVDEFAPRISPDGRWVAYQSAPDVFISPLPGPGPRHQIIVDGRGGMPLWSHDGRRLYYTEDRRLMSVTLAWSPSFAILSRDTVLTDRLDERVLFHANWDVSPDERSFLLNQMVAGPRLIFVHDWRQELRERVSGGGGGR